MTPEQYAAGVNQLDEGDIVARTAYGEARNQGRDGMCAVINVIQNRVKHPSWWGYNFRGVCLARYQFSCWDEDDPNLHVILAVTTADPQYVTALYLADAAVEGLLGDITDGADSYLVTGTPARWAEGLTPVCVIGKHSFFITRKT